MRNTALGAWTGHPCERGVTENDDRKRGGRGADDGKEEPLGGRHSMGFSGTGSLEGKRRHYLGVTTGDGDRAPAGESQVSDKVERPRNI